MEKGILFSIGGLIMVIGLVFLIVTSKTSQVFYFKIRLVDLRILYHVSIYVFINW